MCSGQSRAFDLKLFLFLNWYEHLFFLYTTLSTFTFMAVGGPNKLQADQIAQQEYIINKY